MTDDARAQGAEIAELLGIEKLDRRAFDRAPAVAVAFFNGDLAEALERAREWRQRHRKW